MISFRLRFPISSENDSAKNFRTSVAENVRSSYFRLFLKLSAIKQLLFVNEQTALFIL